MSIATELAALNTNLIAAKAAVNAKGGTTGDTGLSGLSNEIASIPTSTNIKNSKTIDGRALYENIEASNFINAEERTYSELFSLPLTPKPGYTVSYFLNRIVYKISSTEFLCIVEYLYGDTETSLNSSLSGIRVNVSSGTPVWGTETPLGNYTIPSESVGVLQRNDIEANQHPIIVCTRLNGQPQDDAQIKIIRCTSGGTPTISASSYDYRKYSDYTSTSLFAVSQLSTTSFVVASLGYVAGSMGGTSYVELLTYAMSTSEASATAGPTNRTSLGSAFGVDSGLNILPLTANSIILLAGSYIFSQNAFSASWSGSSITMSQITNSLQNISGFRFLDIFKSSSSGDNYSYLVTDNNGKLALVNITSSSISTADTVNNPLEMGTQTVATRMKIFGEVNKYRISSVYLEDAGKTRTFTISNNTIIMSDDSTTSFDMAVRVSDTQYWSFGFPHPLTELFSTIDKVVKINPEQTFNYATMPKTNSVNGVSLKDISSSNTSNAIALLDLS